MKQHDPIREHRTSGSPGSKSENAQLCGPAMLSKKKARGVTTGLNANDETDYFMTVIFFCEI
jgi:hypothetical protein